uniref:Protein kinase domain-containing protein n=1 Tax=Chloropicon laureae TaxID=464258 RepID=A0A7S2YUU1_9CHLO|mmetsp:Transcript_10721/g.27483  ORF Transcript_10721/g.27483 Transcript_10721/m.27483 type:complete len:537 (+) Transcript_10721:67-1677(+)
MSEARRLGRSTYTLVRCIAHDPSGDVFLAYVSSPLRMERRAAFSSFAFVRSSALNTRLTTPVLPLRFLPFLRSASARREDDRTGSEVAIHVIDLESVSSEELTLGSKRIAVHSQCNTPFLQAFVGSYTIPKTTKLCHVSEYMDYSVGDILRVHQKLSESAISEVLRVVCTCLEYLHDEKGIAHQKIRASSVLLDKAGSAKKLIPFSIFDEKPRHRREHEGQNFSQEISYWSAPEVVCGGEGLSEEEAAAAVGPAADVWSVGIAALEMALGKPPLADLDPARATFLLKQGESARCIPGTLSKTLQHFVALCLQKDPSIRPTASELLKHKFLAKPGKGARLQDYMHKVRAQTKLLALTPRFGINGPERSLSSDAFRSDGGEGYGDDGDGFGGNESGSGEEASAWWEFEDLNASGRSLAMSPSGEESLVLAMLDRLSKQMARKILRRSEKSAASKVDRERWYADLEDATGKLAEIFTDLLTEEEQEEVEASVKDFMEDRVFQAFRRKRDKFQSDLDARKSLRMGLFSRFVIDKMRRHKH